MERTANDGVCLSKTVNYRKEEIEVGGDKGKRLSFDGRGKRFDAIKAIETSERK